VTKVAPFTGIFEKSPPVVRSDKAPGSSTLSRKNVISRKSGRSLFRVHSRVDYRGLGGGGQLDFPGTAIPRPGALLRCQGNFHRRGIKRCAAQADYRRHTWQYCVNVKDVNSCAPSE
jgi:hypothetical protein